MTNPDTYTPQAFPLYTMVVDRDRSDMHPDYSEGQHIEAADICIVIGWEHSDGINEAFPVLAQIDMQMSAGMLSPMWPVTDALYYEIRTARPTESDRIHFAEKVAGSVRSRILAERNRGK